MSKVVPIIKCSGNYSGVQRRLRPDGAGVALTPNTPRRTLVRAIKARWACEQAHQQLKDELGLDHYEGRSWLGLHHHALLTMIAFTYL